MGRHPDDCSSRALAEKYGEYAALRAINGDHAAGYARLAASFAEMVLAEKVAGVITPAEPWGLTRRDIEARHE